jgi:hypothetical protein
MSCETRSLLIAWTVAVALLWLTASRGLCGELDGNALLETCTDALRYVDNGYRRTRAQDAVHFGWCVGYTMGWMDAYPWAAALRLPKITAVQLVRIVVQYLRDHPQRLHDTRDVLIRSALQEAFPCAAVARCPQD